MADTTPNVLVDADPRSRVAVRPFLLDGSINLAIALKLTLQLVDQGPARFLEPSPIILNDTPWQPEPVSSIQRAEEVGLAKKLCDVTLTGSVFSPHGNPAPSLLARLALVRNSSTLLDKTIVARGGPDRNGQPTLLTSLPLVWENAFGGTGAGRAPADLNPVGSDRPRLIDAADPQRPAGFGPISSRWPSRTEPVTALLLKTLRSALPELPISFPWSYFQSAPPDQQIPFLSGDEWILLEGFRAELATIRTRIPGIKAFGFLVDASGVTSVPLNFDTLAIDTHDLTVSIVYRGMVRGSALEEIAISARLTSGGERLVACDSHSIRARAKPQPLMMPRTPRAPNPNETALPGDSGQFDSRALRDAGAPFAIPSPAADRPSARPTGAQRAPLPWENVRVAVTPAANLGRTMALQAVDVAALTREANAPSRNEPRPELRSEPPRSVPIPQPLQAPPPVVSPQPMLESLEPNEHEREVTPPSRAALAATELRNAGFSEERVQQIMRDWRAVPP